jgi:hypothetical protein
MTTKKSNRCIYTSIVSFAMDCSFKSCFFWIALGFGSAIGLLICCYIIGYAYFAYTAQKYYSNDLVEQRERRLVEAEQRYNALLNAK